MTLPRLFRREEHRARFTRPARHPSNKAHMESGMTMDIPVTINEVLALAAGIESTDVAIEYNGTKINLKTANTVSTQSTIQLRAYYVCLSNAIKAGKLKPIQDDSFGGYLAAMFKRGYSYTKAVVSKEINGMEKALQSEIEPSRKQSLEERLGRFREAEKMTFEEYRLHDLKKTTLDCIFYYHEYIYFRASDVARIFKENKPEIHDKYFNPPSENGVTSVVTPSGVQEKPEAAINPVPKAAVLSDTGDKEPPIKAKQKKGWSDPWAGLDNNEIGWIEMRDKYLHFMGEQESKVYFMKTACDPKLSDVEIGERLGITRQAVANAFKRAKLKVEKRNMLKEAEEENREEYRRKR